MPAAPPQATVFARSSPRAPDTLTITRVQTGPWALRKTDPARMADVLRVLADVLRDIATVLQPFMPDSMAAMLDQLGVPQEARGLADLAVALPAGTVLPPPKGVFPRFVEPTA